MTSDQKDELLTKMAEALRVLGDDLLGFWCPGCMEMHVINTDQSDRPAWSFNGNFDAPIEGALLGSIFRRPIPFNGPMVRAILEGRKTQTRRVLKPQPPQDWRPLPYLGELHRMEDGEPVEPRTKRDIIGPGWTEEDGLRGFRAPCDCGDRLWVREAWKAHAEFDKCTPRGVPQGSDIQYLADNPVSPWDSRTRPSMFMPRWLSRITLIVTDVRVQRIQEISSEDVRAEGIYERSHVGDDPVSPEWTWDKTAPRYETSRTAFKTLWNSIHGPDAWDRNDWVAAITFEKESANADA